VENEEQNAVMTTTTTMMMMMMMMMMMPNDGNACLLSVSAMCVTTAIQKFAEDADDSPQDIACLQCWQVHILQQMG